MKTDDAKRATAQKKLEKIIQGHDVSIKSYENRKDSLSEPEKKLYENLKAMRKKASDELNNISKMMTNQ